MSYNEIVNINVGGTRFMTSRQTLMREPSSLLGRMFDIDSSLKPAAMLDDGAYFLDRDPKKFEIILNYLREDELAMMSKTNLINLKIEARYFQLKNLEAEINIRLDKMEVYKFIRGDKCFVVRKSYFQGVPFEAIVDYMCEGKEINEAFANFANPIKASFDNETITLSMNCMLSTCFQLYIRTVRNHLVFHYKYVWVKATHININICGWLFKVETELALKDERSNFSRCWYDKHYGMWMEECEYMTRQNSLCLCNYLKIDADSNLTPEYCICGEKICRPDANSSEFSIQKEFVLECLETLRASQAIWVTEEDNQPSSKVDDTLYLLGFLSRNGRLGHV